MKRLMILTALLIGGGARIVAGQSQPFVNAQLPWHASVTDAQGKLLAWHQPEKNLGYDKVLRLGWDFIKHKVPADTRHGTGLKVYLIGPVFHPETLQNTNWQVNAAMLYASFVDSLVAWYAYSGDQEAIATVRGMLDHHLANGMTPADWAWPRVPFSTACAGEAQLGRCLAGLPREFYGGLETDKVAELGLAFVWFYELTGEKKYLEAGLSSARALAKHVRPGDEDRTPWPFRINARTGDTVVREEYGGNVVAAVKLFDELIRIGEGDREAFQKARDTAWNWLRAHPLNRASRAYNRWTGYFEDVAHRPDNINQVSPGWVARYIMDREDPASLDPQWTVHVGTLIDFVRRTLGRGPYYGAWAIDEQAVPGLPGCCSRAGLGSHTSRWAAVNAMYYEKTGDGQAREDAFRSLNYSTYFAGEDGRISCCGSDYARQYWFSDGYSDYLRHFNWVMASIPELAPMGQDHLLRSTSVVKRVSYERKQISYATFDSSATEVLRLSFKPARITAGGAALSLRKDLRGEGYTLQALNGGDFVVRLKHVKSPEVIIRGE